MERCHGDRRHVEHVRLLALSLFDQLGERMGTTEEERFLLEAASLLHDVGQLVSYRKHHKHSFQLIMHAERLPLSPRERMLVALISRYHRRRGPRKKHEHLSALEPADRDIVRRMSGLLRVADGLTAVIRDRGDGERRDLSASQTIKAAPRYAEADLSLECWGGNQKADVLAKVMGREVVIEPATTMPMGPRAVA